MKRVKVLRLILPLPPSAHSLGYSDRELKRYMTAEEWEKFQKWMVGQTLGVDEETGECLTYPGDAERGIRLIRYGTPTFFD